MQNAMQNNDEVSRLFAVAREFRFAMLTTVATDRHLHARPMAIARLDDEDGALWFLIARDHASVAELQRDDRALVTMQSTESYVQWSGHATLVDDSMQVHDLWDPSFSPWFPEGPDPSKLAVLRVDLEIGEYWDRSGAMKLRAMLRRAKESIVGRSPDEPLTHEERDRAHGRVHAEGDCRRA